jgi:hypothetical protein
VFQGQKVRLFRPSPSFLAEAQPSLKTGEDKRNFWALNFLSDRTNYKAKERHNWKNYKFILYLPFSNR